MAAARRQPCTGLLRAQRRDLESDAPTNRFDACPPYPHRRSILNRSSVPSGRGQLGAALVGNWLSATAARPSHFTDTRVRQPGHRDASVEQVFLMTLAGRSPIQPGLRPMMVTNELSAPKAESEPCCAARLANSSIHHPHRKCQQHPPVGDPVPQSRPICPARPRRPGRRSGDSRGRSGRITHAS
jgi:hypothetical protein